MIHTHPLYCSLKLEYLQKMRMRICEYDSGGSVGVFWNTVATLCSKTLHLRKGPHDITCTAGLVPGRSARGWRQHWQRGALLEHSFYLTPLWPRGRAERDIRSLGVCTNLLGKARKAVGFHSAPGNMRGHASALLDWVGATPPQWKWSYY